MISESMDERSCNIDPDTPWMANLSMVVWMTLIGTDDLVFSNSWSLGDNHSQRIAKLINNNPKTREGLPKCFESLSLTSQALKRNKQ